MVPQKRLEWGTWCETMANHVVLGGLSLRHTWCLKFWEEKNRTLPSFIIHPASFEGSQTHLDPTKHLPPGARNTFHHHLQGEKEGAESQWSQGILVRTGYVYLSLISDILTMERQGHFFDEISLSFTVQFICDVEFAGPLFSWGTRLAISSHCDIDSFCSWDLRQHLQARIACQCVYSAETK